MGNELRGWYKPDKNDLPYRQIKKHKPKPKHRQKKKSFAKNRKKEFFKSREWKELRYQAFVKYGNYCMCCGISASEGAIMQVDHIKPRHKHPDLALDINNLQILCASCNRGKYSEDETDWRMDHIREIVKYG